MAFPVVLVAYIAQFVTTAGRSYFLQSIDGIIILLIAIGCVIWTVAPAGKLGANLPEDLHCFITVSLNPDGVTTTIRETDTVFAWDRITTIEERSGFVTFRHGEGILAYVPMHAFLDSAHRDAFVSAALAYRRGDRPGTSGIWPPAPAMRS